MVQRYELPDGTILARIKTPIGEGYDYYIDQGPIDGLIYIGTTSFQNAHPVYNAMLMWDAIADYIEPQIKDPKPEFNRKGWVL